jgi:hypothetical protein
MVGPTGVPVHPEHPVVHFSVHTSENHRRWLRMKGPVKVLDVDWTIRYFTIAFSEGA